MVISVMLVIFGLIGSSFARKDSRRQAVMTSAEELAATFRRARAMAVDRKATFAVVFNIQNDPDSSGRVLNNRSGGHWYRILRPPSTGDQNTIDNIPDFPTSIFGPYTVCDYKANVTSCWMDDTHVLPARKVRFLSLTDMDWGDFTGQDWQSYGRRPGAGGSQTFPRPWFGWWDGATKRLYPWGGYDPAIAPSGFYFWGNANAPSGYYNIQGVRDPIAPTVCRNTCDRYLDHWVVCNTNPPRNPEGVGTDLLYANGSPRPLLNADWRDASLLFLSDGSVRWGGWLPARHLRDYSGPNQRGVPERCNAQPGGFGGPNHHTKTEASNFDQDSGGWFITLAPDADTDKDTFETAKDALDSLMPMVRVFVSKFGEVRVIPVSRTPKFAGTAPFPTTANWYNTGSNVQREFGMDRVVDRSVSASDGTGLGRVVGAPITDFITPDMLAKRQVWMR